MPSPTTEAVLAMGRDLDLLADAYVQDARLVARLCDEQIDRSGRLLGEVRERVRSTGRTGGYPTTPRPDPCAEAVAAERARIRDGVEGLPETVTTADYGTRPVVGSVKRAAVLAIVDPS